MVPRSPSWGYGYKEALTPVGIKVLRQPPKYENWALHFVLFQGCLGFYLGRIFLSGVVKIQNSISMFRSKGPDLGVGY